MRYSRSHKTATRQRVVESAYRLFTTKGYAATSIDEIMRECGLTRGGFYAHFASKSQLYRHAIDYAASTGRFVVGSEGEEADWIEALLNECVALDGAGRLGFLATDLACGETDVRFAYTHAFKTISRKISQRMAAQTPCSEEAILSLTAMIVGAAAVAQTTDDGMLKAKLLAACKEGAQQLLHGAIDRRSLNFFWTPLSTSSS